MRTVDVTDTTGLQAAVDDAQSGDCIVLEDGTYVASTITATGTPGSPVRIVASSRGKAVFTSGTLELRGSEHVVLDGMTWTSTGNVRIVDCRRCRITNWTFPERPGGSEVVHLTGDYNEHNRIDHSDFGPRGQEGRFIMVHGTNPNLAKHTRIDHNYFHGVEPGPQGGECIVLGGGGAWADYTDTYSIVEHNLFDGCDGDAEVISVKSSSNVIRHNTVRSSKGMIVLRAGNRNVVHHNTILGDGKEGSGGIRFYEEDHEIYANYVDTEGAPLIVGNGTPRGEGFSNAQVFRPNIYRNTFIGRTNGVQIGDHRPLPPVDMTFRQNLVRAYAGMGMDMRIEPINPIYKDNILQLRGTATAGISAPPEWFRVIDQTGSVPATEAADSEDAVATEATSSEAGAAEPAAGVAAPAPLSTSDVGPRARAKPFVHPGVLVSRDQLNFVRSKVDEGAEPWATAYEQMRASKFASLAWEPRPRALVECGPYSTPNLGCVDEREDALAAYTHGLLWYITRDARHAEKAIEILDAWSAALEGHTEHNAPLQAGWSGASFARAGELMKHTYGGWPADRVERFAGMLRDVHLPQVLVDRRPNYNGNWELIMLDAAVGISVFLDDRESFNTAVDIWKRRVPAYFYLESDGPLPVPPPDGTKDTPEELIAYWQGQDTFVDGLSQETCRRFHYVGWGIAATAHVAETARIQGLGLYGGVKERLTKAMEFHAAYDLGAEIPDWLCSGTADVGLGPTLEVAYNHYKNRAAVNLPLTGDLIERDLRPTGPSHFLGWETLTHAENPTGRR
ncbi:chondroitinase-B domain-containing protein [Actinopolymorpha sp. B9G3]|uniref:chondroitinase-B domain-containing protein n=1 Tax=Actinopolymorpha sp. B9G3 TaxID=3158970 RepID=UPI0032D8E07B